jgi:ADP-ribosyl-[dinitrogen reductase] hydrolase
LSKVIHSRDRFRGTLLGLAAGDALGAAVEFAPRGSFDPIEDMIGGGPFGLAPGEWTDDTSMALCLAESLLERRGFDAEDQMKRYVRWYREGYMSHNGRCFDVGKTTRRALEHFEASGNPFAGPTDEKSAGNACIARLAPVVLFFHPDEQAATRYAQESARTTHGAQECLAAAGVFATILHRALSGVPKWSLLQGLESLDLPGPLTGIAHEEFLDKEIDEIRGAGYVVDSLEAGLWCVFHEENYRDAVLQAVNLGEDADSTAAIAGQLAGALYGAGSIPAAWLEMLAWKAEITDYADRLHEIVPDGSGAATSPGGGEGRSA